MKITLLKIAIVTSICVAYTSCRKLDLAVDVPDCIERKIRKIRNSPVQNPPASVLQWKADGQTYYYITSGCCDQYNFLYDSECKEICAPDGGMTGGGDGNCPEFQDSVITTLVWKDDRTY